MAGAHKEKHLLEAHWKKRIARARADLRSRGVPIKVAFFLGEALAEARSPERNNGHVRAAFMRDVQHFLRVHNLEADGEIPQNLNAEMIRANEQQLEQRRKSGRGKPKSDRK